MLQSMWSRTEVVSEKLLEFNSRIASAFRLFSARRETWKRSRAEETKRETRGRHYKLCNNAARLKFSSVQFHRAIVTSPCTLSVPHNCRVPARLIESKLMPVTGRTSGGMMAAYRTHKSSGHRQRHEIYRS